MKEKILDEIVHNTTTLMKCITIKDNYEEFDKSFKIIKDELKDYYITEKKIFGYNNLIISNTKSHNLDIIFCSHIDVVPNDKYTVKIKDGKIYGRGSFDMKGQLSVIISLLKNNKTDKKIAFIITSDEEIGGACCKEILKGYNSSLAIVPDAGKNFELITREKGLLQLKIDTKGKQSHSSQPYNGENAILKNIEIYNKMIEKYRMSKGDYDFITTVNLSKLEGGSSVNIVPDRSIMVLDIRFTNDDSIQSIMSDIDSLTKDSEVSILDSGPAFYVDINNKYIKEFMNNFKKITGKECVINGCSSTSDAIYFSEKGIPTILMNPKGDYWHSPKEYAEIDSFYTLYLLFKSLI